MKMRKSYRITKAGSLNNLVLVDEELDCPADNEVTVDVRAIGLNFADVFTILGLYKAAPKSDFIPGIEFSGVIRQTGKSVADHSVGERVMGSIRFGAFTSRLNIDSTYVIKIPEEWSFEEGASFIVQSLTAYYALVRLGDIKREQTVLIHSAAGGVGMYANRIAKKIAAYTIGSVGNSSKLEALKGEGYDRVIVRDGGFRNRLAEALGERKLDIILDSLGGKIQKESFDFLAPSGRMVSYGATDFASAGSRPNYFRLARKYIGMARYDSLNLIESNRSIMGFNLIWLYSQSEMLKGMIREILALRLPRPYVGQVLPFTRLKDAVRLLQSGKTVGKVVVTV